MTKLQALLKVTFKAKAVVNAAENAFKIAKTALETELKKGDYFFTREMIETDDGKITFSSRSQIAIDAKKLEKLVDKNIITWQSLLNISSVNAKDLEKLLGEHEFNKVATVTESVSFAVSANKSLTEAVEKKILRLA